MSCCVERLASDIFFLRCRSPLTHESRTSVVGATRSSVLCLGPTTTEKQRSLCKQGTRMIQMYYIQMTGLPDRSRQNIGIEIGLYGEDIGSIMANIGLDNKIYGLINTEK